MNPDWGQRTAASYSAIPFVRNAQTLRNLGNALNNAPPNVTSAIPVLAEKLAQVYRGEVSIVSVPDGPARQLQVVLNGKPVFWQASNKVGRSLDWTLHSMLMSALRALRKELDTVDGQRASAELFATAEALYPLVWSWLHSIFEGGEHEAAPVLTLDTRGLVAAKRSIHAADLNVDFGQRVATEKPRRRATAQTALGQTLEAEGAAAPLRTKRRKSADPVDKPDNPGGATKARR